MTASRDRGGDDIEVSEYAGGPVTDDATEMGRDHVRGSMLLLLGRVASLLFTVATQVVIVRALSKEDFGVFAFAFTMVGAGRVLLSLGQGRLLSRFMAKYEEENDYPRMLGSMVLAVGTIAITSTVVLVVVGIFAGSLVDATLDAPNAVQVLLVLMFLAPLEALDQVFVALFAAFTRPRAIFFRKYIVTPGLRLIVVLVIAILGGSVFQLALGYLITSLIGIVIYVVLLVGVLRGRGIMHHFHPRRIILPFKAVFSFSLPTLTSELVFLATHTLTVLLLGIYWAATEVADFRAVLPAARLNQAVYQTFVTLFLPMAARLFARSDHGGLRSTYWHSSVFLAVATYPIFAMTTVFARETTVTLFGERYASAGWVLMAMCVGYYFSIALGFNVFVLQVYGRLGFLVWSNVGVAAVSVGLMLLLIPEYGALGAAIATTATLVGQNVVNQIVLNKTLHAATGGRGERYLRPYLVIVAVTAALAAVNAVFHPSFVIAIVIAAVGSLIVLRLTRESLQLSTTFPELTRVPLLRRLIH